MTAQIHEIFIIEGEKASMAFCPPIPLDDPRIKELSDEEIDDSFFFFSTVCWRKYIGTWEIKSDKFYLKKIEGKYKLSSGEPIFAEWFSGILRVPKGRMLHYVHMGFGSVFEEEIHITIEKGILQKTKKIDNRKKEISTFQLSWKNLPGFENRFDGDNRIYFNNKELLDEINEKNKWNHYLKIKPIWAIKLVKPQTVETLEGQIAYNTGEYLCKGSSGDIWGQKEETLFMKYRSDSNSTPDKDGWQQYLPKLDSKGVFAVSIDHDFEVTHPEWGTSDGKAGDYLVMNYNENMISCPKDIWIVKKEIFLSTYELFRKDV